MVDKQKVIQLFTLSFLAAAVAIGGIFLLASDSSMEVDQEHTFEFVELTEEYGFDYSAAEHDELYGAQNFMSASGVYASDVTDNGYPDALLLGGEAPSLYENKGGDFTEAEFPDINGFPRAAMFFDADGDGTDDILLLRMNDSPLLLENTNGEFEPRPGMFEQHLTAPTAATAADFTGNGCLDVFITQNGDLEEHAWRGLAEEQVPLEEDNGLPNYLFWNDCTEFEKSDMDVFDQNQWSLATSAVDFTGNGWPDIHVANDFNRDLLYLNQGNGSFEMQDMGENTNRNGMSSVVNDISGNGFPDLFVTNIWFSDEMEERLRIGAIDYRSDGNHLFLNQGDGNLEDEAKEKGVEKGGWGWGSVVQDLNNNGNIDIVHATSDHESEVRAAFQTEGAEELIEEYDFYRYPVALAGTDSEFRTLNSSNVGLPPLDGRGIADFDANGDGTLDVLISTNDGDFKFFENQEMDDDSIVLDVRSDGSTPAVGASLKISTEDTEYHRWVDSQTDYLSQSDTAVHVGLGELDQYETVDISIEWPDGTVQEHLSVDPNARYQLTPSEKTVVNEFE